MDLSGRDGKNSVQYIVHCTVMMCILCTDDVFILYIVY